ARGRHRARGHAAHRGPRVLRRIPVLSRRANGLARSGGPFSVRQVPRVARRAPRGRGADGRGAVLRRRCGRRRARARPGVRSVGRLRRARVAAGLAAALRRARARRMVRRASPGGGGADSAWVPYRVTDSHLLGQVVLRLGADSVVAAVDARVRGLVLDPSWLPRREIRRFASRGARGASDVAAVALAVRLGAFTLTNVPVRFELQHARDGAVVGLDVLAAMAATFDPVAGRMLLRRSGVVAASTPGYRIPTLVNEQGVFVVKAETVFPIGHPDVQQYLRRTRWTLDAPNGEVIVSVR